MHPPEKRVANDEIDDVHDRKKQKNSDSDNEEIVLAVEKDEYAPCVVCGEAMITHKFPCLHHTCEDCMVQYLSTCIKNLIGKVPSDLRFTCPGASNGKKCSFPIDVDYVYRIIQSHKNDAVVVKEKSAERMDQILLHKCMTQFPEYKACPVCADGYGSKECGKDWAKCHSCNTEFCEKCGTVLYSLTTV